MKILFVAALALLALPAVIAHPESAAPALNPIVERAWHEPETVEPGTQWEGFLRLLEGHNVSSASYQVCNAGNGFCFAPPTAAALLDNRTFSFDTSNYLALGKPVEWKAGWRVGVSWCLGPPESCTWLPAQSTGGSIESHYLTFDIPSEPKGIPAPSWLMVGAALLVAALARRR